MAASVANQVAASIHPQRPRVERDHQPRVGEARSGADLLPTWAQSIEARVLLSLVMIERPERTKPIATDLSGNTASFGYRGKNAARLREMFEAARSDMIHLCPQPSEPGYEEARAGIITWSKANSSDALIARLIVGEA